MPRIVHVITGLETGGAEWMLFKVLRATERSEFPSAVIALRGGGTAVRSAIEDLGVPVRSLNFSAAVGLQRLRRAVREFEPDLVLGWMPHGNLAALLGAAGTGTPVLWNVRMSLDALDREKVATRAAIRLGALLSSAPRAILYNSQAGAAQHEAFGYRTDRTVIVPNGFDTVQFRPDAAARAAVRAEFDIPAHARVIGMINRFHAMKGHPDFLAAAAGLADREDIHFLLAGRGVDTHNAELQQAVAAHPAARRIHLLGERTDVARLAAALDISTLASRWGEGFPNVVGEAMSCGVPCVVTDVGDAASIVGPTGLVVPPARPDAMARAWNTLLDAGAPQLAAMGAAARQRIAEHFSIDAVARRYEAIFSQHAAARARTAALSGNAA